ncbi:hypothetical protein TQ38_021585 [Novosphingobium sp. P6W]|nr:hypothetical protein TQ38_021585 [Novosphingobium sp. P6W]KIS30402.1 hypothetical protein TQ38_22495 [Novosphingobium sp. P6W]
MDLNKLLYEQQLALIKASRSSSGALRDAHSKVALHYATRVREFRRRTEVQQYDDHHNDLRETPALPELPSDIV